MKQGTKNLMIFSIFVFTIACAPGVSAAHYWTVCPGDVITWELDSWKDDQYKPSPVIEDWTLIMSVDGFADWYGQEYVNGTFDENGSSAVTFLNNIVQYSVGPSDNYWVNDPIDGSGDPISMKLIETVSGLASIGTKLQDIATTYSLNYQKTTTSNMTSFHLWGSWEDTANWTYDAVINYTSDRVLYSIDDDLHGYDGVVEDLYENYNWRLTNYAHGTCPPSIPGYSTMLILFLSAMVVLIHVYRRYKVHVRSE
ncbi:MAG: hypothetical protein ACTSUE_19085 [Promethearchaeota archaeon]